MTNFKKRKTRKRYNKNNRKKRTRKLKGGGEDDIINNIKEHIKAQQVRHPIDFKRNDIWNHPDGQVLRPKWLNILTPRSQILPGIGAIYNKDKTL